MDKLNELPTREEMVKAFAEQRPELRAVAFTNCFSKELVLSSIDTGRPKGSMTLMLMTLIHICDRYPDWLKAVVSDTPWVLTDGKESGKTAEETMKDVEADMRTIMSWYPLPLPASITNFRAIEEGDTP